MPTKYRLVVKPLTEKTSNAPRTGEILVNTEDGHVSVATRKGVKSSTRDIEAQLLIKQVLVEKTDETLRAVIARLETVTIPYFEERLRHLAEVDRKVRELATIIDNLLQEIVRSNKYAEMTTRNLLDLYLLISNMTVNMADCIALIIELENSIGESRYLEESLSTYSTTLTADIEALKSFYKQVKDNVDSRVDEAIFNTWKRDLLQSYTALEAKSTVANISFIYNQ